MPTGWLLMSINIRFLVFFAIGEEGLGSVFYTGSERYPNTVLPVLPAGLRPHSRLTCCSGVLEVWGSSLSLLNKDLLEFVSENPLHGFIRESET